MKNKISKKIIILAIIILLVAITIIYLLIPKNNFQGVTDSITTKDNKSITVGMSPKENALIIKKDNSKKVEWQESLEADRSSRFTSIKETSDDNFIVLGTFDSRTLKLNNGQVLENPDYYESEIPQLGIQTPSSTMLIKYDMSGRVLWGEFLGSENITVRDILVTNDGGFILGGAINSDLKIDNKTIIQKTNNDEAYENAVLLKFDSDGKIEWNTSAITGKKLAASDMPMNYTEVLSLKLENNNIIAEIQVGSRTDTIIVQEGKEIAGLYDGNSNSTKKIVIKYDMNGNALNYEIVK